MGVLVSEAAFGVSVNIAERTAGILLLVASEGLDIQDYIVEKDFASNVGNQAGFSVQNILKSVSNTAMFHLF